MSLPAYPKYKDSGVEWLGKVPEHWDLVPLKHLADFFNGDAFKPTDWADSGIPIIRIQNLNGSDDFNYHDGTVESRYLINRGELLFGWSGNRGTSFGPFIWDRDGIYALNQHIFRVVPNKVEKDALYWILKAVTSHVEDQAHGIIGMVHITKGDLGSIRVPIPPKLEQDEIALFVAHETAKIDASITEQERLIDLLKEKRQAVISHAVTKGLNPDTPMKDSGAEWIGQVPSHWEICRIKNVARLESGHTPSKQVPEYWENCQIQWVSLNDSKQLAESDYISETAVRINELGLANSSARLLPPGAVVFTRDATIGLAAITARQMAVSQHLIAWCPGERIAALYLLRVFNVMKSFLDSYTFGATIKTIGMADVKKLVTPLPPPHEQDEITEFVDDVIASTSLLISDAICAIELLHERRTALISAAVTGKIDVRGRALATAPKKKPYSSGFARQLLAAEILHHCHHDLTMGRVKLQKLIHLCEHVAEIDEIAADYRRESAGPFDNKVMFGIASALAKQGWFSEVREGGRAVYRPLHAAGEHKKYLTPWESKLPRINYVLSLLGTAKTQQCEIVSTLYAAWNDLLIERRSPSDVEIIHEASAPDRWHESKANIAPEKWVAALRWMREKQLVPSGWGQHTKHEVTALAGRSAEARQSGTRQQ